MNYNESDTAILECEVITFPSPNITWIKRNQNIGAIIVNSQRTNITFTYSLQSLERPTAISRLMLTSVSLTDGGTYSCHVSTDIPGFYAVSSQVNIYVHGKTLHLLNIVCVYYYWYVIRILFVCIITGMSFEYYLCVLLPVCHSFIM